MTAVSLSVPDASSASINEKTELHEASFYDKLGDGKIQCTLCPWNCTVPPGKRGHCEVRENRDGKYYSLIYGRPCARHNDPIEKKPFYHVYPGSKSYSIATVGCNIDCKFCQNWEISQALPEQITTRYFSPEQIARLAKDNGSKTVAYTYTEPTIFFEYMVDCAKAAKDLGIGNVVVSNGFIEEKPLKELCSIMTAIKIDLKAFSQSFYGKQCGGRLEPVKDTLKTLSESDIWYEIVVLLIPTLNDNMDEIKEMSAWIAKELGQDVPIHFTRFYPQYKIRNLPPTPPNILNKARRVAMAEGLNYVYGGNMPGIKGENTYCPQCGELAVNRYGHSVLVNHLKNGKCKKCGKTIPGVW
jgi:pyruvate formate lyase activating enzyme